MGIDVDFVALIASMSGIYRQLKKRLKIEVDMNL